MRFHEFDTATEHYPPRRPVIHSLPHAVDVKLAIRIMPAVYRWLSLELRHGGPAADISFEHARVWFPKIYDADGALTGDCRQWIVEMVQDWVEREKLSVSVVWSNTQATYCWTGKEPLTTNKLPEGGLSI